MGHYASFFVAGYEVLTSKYDVVPQLMTVFRERDKKKSVSKDEDGNNSTVVKYSCTVGVAAARLDVMGFSLERAKREYEEGRKYELDQLTEGDEDIPDDHWAADSIRALRALDFAKYREWLTVILQDHLTDTRVAGLAPEIKYILQEHDDEAVLGFHHGDIRLPIRVACACVDCDAIIDQDISDLLGVSYTVDEPVCEQSLRRLIEDHPSNAPTIILTEGSTDGKIIEAALSILYPHLVGYYSFLDFESARMQGGAGSLVSVVKAFAGAGITNRVMALFDNDTAARDAVRSLRAVKLPNNFAVLHYPETDLLRSYPTIGPTGVSNVDVNGLAASIELFLGADVLTVNGALSPIRWRGYIDAMGQYQGEVGNKPLLQGRFKEKAARALAAPAALNRADWADLNAILRSVFAAFPE